MNAARVTRMNFAATPVVHENAPRTAPAIFPKIDPSTTTRAATGCAPVTAAAAGTAPTTSRPANTPVNSTGRHTQTRITRILGEKLSRGRG
jgi:hypothetical protein